MTFTTDCRRSQVARGVVIAAVVLGSGCSIRSMAVNALSDTLAEGASVYASDNDPELVREALPFNLKTVETLLQSSPEHRGLLLIACSTFTQYAAAFIQADAEVSEWEDFDYAAAAISRARALNLYIRARNYCLRRVEIDYPGLADRLRLEPAEAVSAFGVDDTETMYWLGGSWGFAISLGLDQPDLAADLPVVRALLARALELDEDYNRGALHSAFLTLESMPELLGGSPTRARAHFERAVELSGGLDASPYVAMATGVSLATQDREAFESLLGSALAVDPEADMSIRLLNLVTQKRARLLLDHADELFEAPLEQEEDNR
jgi:predicted anti-sigma-YlaC factor YlaD